MISEHGRARVIAFYLPQFHPIPENDEWWGKGFTEWTNVARAKPLFKGHYQPRIPKDLGFYDLRLPEVREAQAQLAKEAGIEGFCYWHYWFGNGKQLLERPFNEVLGSGKPDFPFCLGWANHSWSNNSWQSTNSNKSHMLIEQTYPGIEEHAFHFYKLLQAFKDHRYITVDKKPIFVIWNPFDIPNVSEFIKLWNNLAIQNGLNGIHFVGISDSIAKSNISFKKINLASKNQATDLYKKVLDSGFDAVNSRGLYRAEMIVKGRYYRLFNRFIQKYVKRTHILKYEYSKIIKFLCSEEDSWENVYPTLLPQWDRSPRSGAKTDILVNSTPDIFELHIKDMLDKVKSKDYEHKIAFLMSWNEWAEGNYVEPDIKYGKGYLKALKKCLID